MRLLTTAAVLLLGAVVASAQATQPASAGPASAALELRANESFNKGDFSAALPMLQQVAAGMANQPAQADKLAMVQEQIRVCQKNQASGVAAATPGAGTSATAVATAASAVSMNPATVGNANAGSPPAVPMGADRIPHPTPKPNETLEMSIKELGNFDFDPEHPTPLPGDVVQLSGSKIRLHGYMIPMDQAESISQFALVPSLFACCYGQPPQIQHTIVVNCPKGKAVSYYPDEIVVEGKLDVQEKKDDGFIVSLFDISASSVKPAPK